VIAVEEVNSDGGLLGLPLTLVEYDDRSSPEQAVKAVNKMIQVDGVVAAVGSLHSGNILAAAPVLERTKTPTLGAGTSPSWLEQGYQYLFRAVGNSGLSVRQLALYSSLVGLRRIGVIHGNDEYGTSGANGFIEAAAAKGLEIVTRESFTHGDRDFTGQFARIFHQDPDAVLVWALGDDLGAVTQQLRQAGYEGPILGSEGYTMPQVLEIAGKATDGVILAAQYLIPDHPGDVQDELMRRFLKEYVGLFGDMPASDNAYRGYDAVKIIAEAIRRSNSLDGEEIRNAIQDLENYRGIAGEFTFRGHGGEGIHEMRMYRIEDGGYHEIEPEPGN
jgi:branched-chain amino acid transport system substrate-binding protein